MKAVEETPKVEKPAEVEVPATVVEEKKVETPVTDAPVTSVPVAQRPVADVATSMAPAHPADGPMTPEEKEFYIGPETFKKVDERSRQEFAQDFLVRNAEFLVPKALFDEEKGNSSPARQNLRKQILDQARVLVGSVRGMGGIPEEVVVEAYGCARPEGQSLIQTLQSILDKTEEDNQCSHLPLAEGQSRKFVPRNRLTVPPRHIIKNLGGNKYEALLQLKFPDSDGGKTLEKVKGCLAMIEPFLKGPEGKQLKITAKAPSEFPEGTPSEEVPSMTEIKIAADSESRGDALNYRESWGCDTITHEILHLLGLCDEYHEDERYARQFACRIVPKVPSIMEQPTSFFPKVVPKVIKCTCTGATCVDIASKYTTERFASEGNNPNPCGGLGTLNVSETYGTEAPANTENEFYFKTTPSLKSLLTDVQFERVLAGECSRGIVSTYATCSRFSQLPKEDLRCQNIPPECSDPAKFIGSQPQ